MKKRLRLFLFTTIKNQTVLESDSEYIYKFYAI